MTVRDAIRGTEALMLDLSIVQNGDQIQTLAREMIAQADVEFVSALVQLLTARDDVVAAMALLGLQSCLDGILAAEQSERTE